MTSPLPFVRYPDPALATAAVPRPVDAAMQAAGEHLLAAAAAAQAFGLAGAHLGLVEPVMVVSVSDDLSQRDYRLFFNPQVLETSTAIQSGTEGSVSLPGVEVAISRPVWAVIGYDDAQGQPRTDRFEGFVARCCLHEIEQIGGVFFLSHLSRLKRDAVLRKFKKGLRAG